MRTTIRIDDDLYRQVKRRAVATGRPIGAIIEDALVLALRPRGVTDELEPLPRHGGGGVLPGVELGSMDRLQDTMDRDVAVDALR